MQLRAFALRSGAARVFPETDVRFGEAKVYRPAIVMYHASRLPAHVERLDQPPDLIVEILLAGTKALDSSPSETTTTPPPWLNTSVSTPTRATCAAGSALGRASSKSPPGNDALSSVAFPRLLLDLAPFGV